MSVPSGLPYGVFIVRQAHYCTASLTHMQTPPPNSLRPRIISQLMTPRSPAYVPLVLPPDPLPPTTDRVLSLPTQRALRHPQVARGVVREGAQVDSRSLSAARGRSPLALGLEAPPI